MTQSTIFYIIYTIGALALLLAFVINYIEKGNDRDRR